MMTESFKINSKQDLLASILCDVASDKSFIHRTEPFDWQQKQWPEKEKERM